MTAATFPSVAGPSRFAGAFAKLRTARVVESRGRVVQVIGLVIESQGPPAALGDVVRIESPSRDGDDGITFAEVPGSPTRPLSPPGEGFAARAGVLAAATDVVANSREAVRDVRRLIAGLQGGTELCV